MTLKLRWFLRTPITALRTTFFCEVFMHMKLSHVIVHLSLPSEPTHELHDVVVRCDVQEAFHLLMSNAFCCRVIKLVPEYEIVSDELSEVSEEED